MATPTTAAHATRDSVKDIWGPRTPFSGDPGNPAIRAWPERIDEQVIASPDRWVQSACVLCSNGCALDIGVKDGRMVGVRGRGADHVNRGRLGPKGLNGWMANLAPDRLTRPLVRRDGALVPVSWDIALDIVVERTREIRNRYTSGAIGFYNTGQLFLEEYYTLALIGHGGIGTRHMDGNTRLCTATAAQALIQSFGTDGDPGCYEDIDLTSALFIVGHNPAVTQTVLWMRILDRMQGPNPPKLVVVDPRRTWTAREADVHLAPKPGTNLALLNGLLHLIIRNGDFDAEFVSRHTIGFDSLEKTVARYTPERVESITGIAPGLLVEAAEILGSAPTLVSTVLQGVYQSHQATASAVQVNNINLIRGKIGRPGSTVFQMNGQPTAQNTRETGANGELVAFRNYQNRLHVEEQARIWNVDPMQLPSEVPPTHVMQMMRYAEEGSLRMLWIFATNPAVSLPDLDRIRSILDRDELFLVVSDAFPNETVERADVVLPAALWGEKTGTFTNADRTVHLSLKATEPPGEARPDFDVLVDFARRLELRDKGGAPLVKWSTPEEAFEHWKGCSEGRPCDYSGLSYALLQEGSGVQWPCTSAWPRGKARLYEQGVFNTDPEECETWGNDLMTGAAFTEEQYRAMNPAGRAILKVADYLPPAEEPDRDYPYLLTTGRLVHHFHTRTKTGRTPALQQAAPEAFVEISAIDAAALDIGEGDLVEVASRRGKVFVPARIGEILPGVVFVPFHYGGYPAQEHEALADRVPNGRPAPPSRSRSAANELTLTVWDPVSKQPTFKCAAVRLRRLSRKPRPAEVTR